MSQIAPRNFVYIIFMLLTMVALQALAEDLPPPVSTESLNRAIDKAFDQPVYRWRMPRQPETGRTADRGWLISAAEWLESVLAGGAERIGRWIGGFIDWLDSLLPRPSTPADRPDVGWKGPVQIALLTVLLAVLALLVHQMGRFLRRRRVSSQADDDISTDEYLPDLSDEEVTADELSARRWLALAEKMAVRGAYRAAIRAYYLAMLAGLADRGLITIECYKSNRDYSRELHRRAHDMEALQTDFATCVQVFEQVWYGCGRTSLEKCRQLEALQKRMLTIAET